MFRTTAKETTKGSGRRKAAVAVLAIEQKQIAEQQLLRAKTEVKIAEQEALKFTTLNRGLNNQVLYKLFLDKWDGKTKVVPGIIALYLCGIDLKMRQKSKNKIINVIGYDFFRHTNIK